MKILVIHNRYLQKGGEDAVFEEETRLLANSGCEVRAYVRDNQEISRLGATRSALSSVWSPDAYRTVQAQMQDWRPDVVHVHNSFPLVSPAAYWAAFHAGVPVVKTLHNFRLSCLQGTFLYRGAPCEACLGKVPWRGVLRRCYRGSASQSAVLAAGLVGHRLAGTYRHQVTRYIALDSSSVERFVAAGIPRQRISIKPNAVSVPAMAAPTAPRQGGVYVGRLSVEKGIAILAAALAGRQAPGFKVIGEGDLAGLFSATSAQLLGQLPPAEVYRHMCAASYLVMPSVGFEQFPRVIAEAFALGLPVIASARGSLASLVEPGRTGLLFEPGDDAALARTIAWCEANPQALLEMGQHCQAVYQAQFTPEANLRALLAIYRQAIDEAPSGGSKAPAPVAST